MTELELETLNRLLVDWEEEDFDDLPEYALGEWSRSNLDAMIADIDRRISAIAKKS